MDSNFVEELLQKVSENEAKNYKKVSVEKQIELNFDLGHLLAVDTNAINSNHFRTNKELCLKELARDNTQLIINQLWELKTKAVDNIVVAQLPKPIYPLPRSKAVPKAKELTKWETYAKDKGILNKKREKLVWDEVSKDWKPRFGFKGINQNRNEWMIEVPNNADPNVDYFQKKNEDKKERIAKNELQRLRNIARSHKMRLPGTAGIVPHLNQSKQQLQKASHLAKHSTASVGKFTESLNKEKPPKNLGKKRRFEPNVGDMASEKDKNLKIFTEIMNKKPKLDINKAVAPMVRQKRSNFKKSKTDFKGKKGRPAIKTSRTKPNKYQSGNKSNKFSKNDNRNSNFKGDDKRKK